MESVIIFLTADQWTKVSSEMEKQWINDTKMYFEPQ